MSKPCPCKKHEECEECPEWIFTFADLVMLMMGFFVILWVLKPSAGKSANDSQSAAAAQEQWLITVGEIRSSLGYIPDPKSSDPVDKAMIRQKMGKRQGAETTKPRKGAVGTDHLSTSIRAGKQSAVGSRLPFEAGSAQLLPETVKALDQIAEKILGHSNIVMVKGHASLDDFPDAATAAQRMDLSLRRAQAAEDYLIAKGIEPAVLRVQGCSTFEPVKQRAYSAEAQAENRRVEVEATAELLENRQDQSAGAAAPASTAGSLAPPAVAGPAAAK
ncbi:MAG TPA: OmpA family protein [Tepidisphaeraceae bacterium]|nr:OmpA family protein [Tepidisphaeraceae bacterium]